MKNKGKKLIQEAGVFLAIATMVLSASTVLADQGLLYGKNKVILFDPLIGNNGPCPLGEDEISFYDKNAETYYTIGLTSGGTFEGAIRITPAELNRYDGWNLTAVRFGYDSANTDEHSGQVKIYAQGTSTRPGSLLTSIPFTVTEAGWILITLTTPILLDITKDIWVSVEITHLAGEHPLVVDDGPAVDGKGDWVYAGGWDELQNLELDYNWLIEGIVAGAGPSGTEIAIASISGGFGGVTASVTNAGESEAVEVNMSMTVQGGLLGLINKEVIVYQESLQPGASAPIESGMIFGLGKVTITVTAEAANADPVTKSATGFAFGPMILGVK